MKRVLAVLCLCLFAASCEEARTGVSTPIGPSPSLIPNPGTLPKPDLYPRASWTLNASITSVTPHPCWNDVTGLSSDWMLAVDRAEMMGLFVYWDPTDGIEYVGSLSGQDFVLAGRVNGGNRFSIGCASGGVVEVILTGRVSGRFSDDGRSISAEEVLSYEYVATGQLVEVRVRWAAAAPPVETAAASRAVAQH